MKYPWAILLLTLVVGAAAQPVEQLYEAVVAVEDRAEATQAKAMRLALSEVAVKLAGNRKILQNPALQKKLADAPKLAREYEYLPPLNGKTRLRVGFNPELANSLLREAGIALWGKDRPLTLGWIAVQDGANWLYLEEHAASQQIVAEQAARRGLPLLFPMLDMEDRAALPAARLAAINHETAQQAGLRYRPDVVWTGTVAQAGGQWQGRWKFYVGGEEFLWDSRKADLAALLSDAVDALTDHLAARVTAVMQQPAAEITVLIQGISNLQEYAKVESYLRGLEAVAALQVEQIEPARIRLKIQARGGRAGLAQAIALGKLLTPLPDMGELAVYQLAR